MCCALVINFDDTGQFAGRTIAALIRQLEAPHVPAEVRDEHPI